MSFSPREIRDEFLKNNIGLIGIGILGALFGLSIIAFVTIPAESLRQ